MVGVVQAGTGGTQRLSLCSAHAGGPRRVLLAADDRLVVIAREFTIDHDMSTPDSAPTFTAARSRRWFQVLIHHRPELIDDVLRTAARLPAESQVEWCSPVVPAFTEYRDEAMLRVLGIELRRRPLADFWPTGGAVWDGLARSATGDVFLVEAKAHVAEMLSTPTAATGDSLARIRTALNTVRTDIATAAARVDWATGPFYQYANRLAHLHLLREQNGVPAHLVLLYFERAPDVPVPADRSAYEGATAIIERCLGVQGSKLLRYVHKVYVDVRDLPGGAQ